MKAFLLLLLAAPAWPATTTVTQMVVGADGNPTAGTAVFRINVECQAGTNYVGSRPITVSFTTAPAPGQTTNNFAVKLTANDSCAPLAGTYPTGFQTSYTVSWTLASGRQYTETWQVPTSSTPLAISAVVVNASLPTPIPQMGLSQVIPGVSDGTYCPQVLNGILSLTTANCPGSGGGGPSGSQTWGSLLASGKTWGNLIGQ